MFKKGQSLRGSFLLIKFLRNSLNYSRFGILISSKTLPKSVDRNRARRVISQRIADSGIISSVSYDVLVRMLKRGQEEDLLEDLDRAINILKNG